MGFGVWGNQYHAFLWGGPGNHEKLPLYQDPDRTQCRSGAETAAAHGPGSVRSPVLLLMAVTGSVGKDRA
jgi:hypothetical protein